MRDSRVITFGLYVALAALLLGATAAFSQSIPPEEMNARSASRLGTKKLMRGCVNVITGWLELVRCPIETVHRKGTALAAPLGIPQGLGMGIWRTVGGVFEIALCFHPQPWEYEPYFNSPTVFDDWPKSS